MKLNLATKEGWHLSDAYREHLSSGGSLSPAEWNTQVRRGIRTSTKKE